MTSIVQFTRLLIERSALPNSLSYRSQASIIAIELRQRSQPSWQYQRRDNSSNHSNDDDGGKRARELVLYDSLSKSYQKINVQNSLSTISSPKGLAWYTCGPTTYAPAHLGHARTYVWMDILRRILEYVSERNNTNGGSSSPTPPPPLFVMNITDVDDKILAAAQESPNRESPLQLARRFEHDFWRDLDALGCLRPHVVTRVSEYVDSAIVPYIEKLEAMGFAYAIPNVGVYFDVRAFDAKLGHLTRYGKLAPPGAATDFFDNHQQQQQQQQQQQHNPEETSGESTASIPKRDARDFAIWKCRKANEELYWDSPWGPGRPGWHIECSAMIEAVQQQFYNSHVFLVHAGGIDLKFPHHTNEIAQAEAFIINGDNDSSGSRRWSGEWISQWVHTGHVHIDGLKMSKSLKNFITIEELLSKDNELSSPLVSPADDFRLWCLSLSGSYRGPATFSYDRIQEARMIRQKIVRFLLDGEEWLRRSGEGKVKSWHESDVQFFHRVNEASSQCLGALLGSKEESSAFDVNGAVFVEQILEIAEIGGDYLRKASHDTTPIEPLVAVLSTLRKLLSLVGFTEATSRAGVNVASNTDQSHVVGGERALIEELVRFRALVREAALASDNDGSNNSNSNSSKKSLRNQILEYSDTVRKTRLPAMGVEIMDPKVTSVNRNNDNETPQTLWRFCSPQTSPPSSSSSSSMPASKEKPKATKSRIDLNTIPLQDLFRVGIYEGRFLEFTADGMPTKNADGTELSITLRKKLLKQRDKHQERLNKQL